MGVDSLAPLRILVVDERHQSVTEPEALGTEPFGVVELAVDLVVGSVAGYGRVQWPLTVAAAETGDVPLLPTRGEGRGG